MAWRLRRITVTGAILIVTVAVSLVVTLANLESAAALVAGFIPLRFNGAELPPGWTAVPAFLTPLSATLIHGGIAHLAVNMLVLAFIGRMCEQAIGQRNTLILYIVGAYAAAALQWLLSQPRFGGDPMVPMIGASGAIAALIAAVAILSGPGKARAIGPIPAIWVQGAWLLIAWIVLNYLLSFAFTAGGMPIAWQAHIGGFLAGLLLAWPLRPRPKLPPKLRVVH